MENSKGKVNYLLTQIKELIKVLLKIINLLKEVAISLKIILHTMVNGKMKKCME
jgi:hypothetical protein